MVSADEAQRIVFENVRPLGEERVPLRNSLHRYVSAPIVAPIDLPPFDNAAMDGFALRSIDTQQASDHFPVSLQVISTIAAGDSRWLSEGSGFASPERGGSGAIGSATKYWRRTGPLLIFALPGNPVSSFTVFERFVRPAICRMMGAGDAATERRVAVATERFKGSPGRESYLRGVVEYRDGRYYARSAGPQGSAQLGSLARSNAVLIIPENKRTVEPLEPVEVVFFGGDR